MLWPAELYPRVTARRDGRGPRAHPLTGRQVTVNEASFDDLREELATLEAEELRISAERRQLHNQIDFGYATEWARAREREVSDERRRLHRRIDSLRETLGLNPGPSKEPDVQQPLEAPPAFRMPRLP